MKKEGSPAHHVEGLEKGRWVLLDFVDFVVHVFHPTLRNFYQLERLWADAVAGSARERAAERVRDAIAARAVAIASRASRSSWPWRATPARRGAELFRPESGPVRPLQAGRFSRPNTS